MDGGPVCRVQNRTEFGTAQGDFLFTETLDEADAFPAASRGARGDLFMSLIHTCELNGANPSDYTGTIAPGGPRSQDPKLHRTDRLPPKKAVSRQTESNSLQFHASRNPSSRDSNEPRSPADTARAYARLADLFL